MEVACHRRRDMEPSPYDDEKDYYPKLYRLIEKCFISNHKNNAYFLKLGKILELLNNKLYYNKGFTGNLK